MHWTQEHNPSVTVEAYPLGATADDQINMVAAVMVTAEGNPEMTEWIGASSVNIGTDATPEDVVHTLGQAAEFWTTTWVERNGLQVSPVLTVSLADLTEGD